MSNEDDIELNNNILKDHTVLIYPEDRIMSDHSPTQIYIPNRVVMFKIMRACIGV